MSQDQKDSNLHKDYMFPMYILQLYAMLQWYDINKLITALLQWLMPVTLCKRDENKLIYSIYSTHNKGDRMYLTFYISERCD